MSQLVILDQEHLDNLIASIDELKKLVERQSKQTALTNSEKAIDAIDNWILLRHTYAKLGISRAQWYSKYQKIIKHRTYAGTTWVYAPSILEFLESNNIN
jgi:hypothetical protein